jgi:hypothetical protein
MRAVRMIQSWVRNRNIAVAFHPVRETIESKNIRSGDG